MPVSADQDVGAWPMVPPIGQKPDEDYGIFGPCGAGAWAEVGGHQRVGGAFENEERQITMVLIGMIIAGQLLLAMGGIIGMIKIEHDSRRRLGEAGNKVIHQGRREPREVLAVDLVFKPRQGERTGQGVLRDYGATLDSQFEQRGMAENDCVIADRKARGNVLAWLCHNQKF